MRYFYKCEHIHYIFHKLLDSIEESLTWCLQFMMGIWDRIQRPSSSPGSELQGEGSGRRECSQWMPRTAERWKIDKVGVGRHLMNHHEDIQ